MNLDVNENGHIFVINRLKNTLYFFYECLGEYKVQKIKYGPTMSIYRVDSSNEFLTIVYKEQIDENSVKYRYSVYNISKMLNPERHSDEFNLSSLEIFNTRTYETKNVLKERVGIDEYSYTITDVRVNKNLLILRIFDHKETTYLKVLDLRDNTLLYYIEGSKFHISGDKKFIW